MTKEEIFNALNEQWDDDLQAELERLVANYSVYQQDPDDFTHTYMAKYFIHPDDALKDFESRDYVPEGRWCKCILVDIKNGKILNQKVISIPIEYD